MEPNYIFHSTSYDRDILRKQVVVLNDNNIDYKLNNKEVKAHAKAPLAAYFEMDIYINEKDFEKADPLLREVIEEYQ